MDGHVGLTCACKGSRKGDAVAFDDQVHVKVRDAEKQVSDEPSDGVHADAMLIGQFTDLV